MIRRIRIVSQGLFLLLFFFLFLQTESKGMDELGYPVRLFLDFDPLILVTTLLSAHAVSVAFYLSLIMIALTAVFGRVFCGWACPLGTLHNMIGAMKKAKDRLDLAKWHKLKYFILIFLLASSLFTLQLAGILDPISLLIRSLSVSVYPLFNAAVGSSFDTVHELNIQSLAGITESVYSFVKKTLMAFEQPYFQQAVFIGLIFFAILALNLYQRRFWCKYLCPLGALLGVISRYSLLKRSVSEGCRSCGLCSANCQAGAIAGDPSGDGKAWRPAECISCHNCDDACHVKAVKFHFGKATEPIDIDLGRRRVITSALAGFVAVPLLRSTPVSKKGFSEPALIRPPGSLPEKEFLQRCVKCGECMKVCITYGLQPTLFEAGLEGIWSPILVSKIGYCEYRCTLCGQVCPTGAIKELPLEEKMKVKIGLAMIDKGRCLPYANGQPCIVCEEVCPTPKKAIWFEEVTMRDRDAKKVTVKQPRVDLELCIGCGICENKCPVKGLPAIYMISAGESRNPENQILL
jgi:polyferredoxin